tara:strand:- start:212 stop:616 length:405 start_codon:yes stop_codon:yes gene_type:complete
MPTYQEVRELFEKQDKLEFFEQGIKDACEKIMRQTDYNYDTSLEKLKQHNMDVMSVVRDWMGVETVQPKNRSTNQMVFDEFRTFLDDASSNYYKKKEIQKAKEEYMQHMRQLASAELERRKKAAEENKQNQLEN